LIGLTSIPQLALRNPCRPCENSVCLIYADESGIKANFAYVGTMMSDRAKNFHPEGVRVSASRKWIGA
jgi:hypothetical protein